MRAATSLLAWRTPWSRSWAPWPPAARASSHMSQLVLVCLSSALYQALPLRLLSGAFMHGGPWCFMAARCSRLISYVFVSLSMPFASVKLQALIWCMMIGAHH